MRGRSKDAIKIGGFIGIVLILWLVSQQGGRPAVAAGNSPKAVQTLPIPTEPVCRSKAPAPASVSAVAGDASATLTWPDSTPPFPCTVSDYQITSSPATVTNTGGSRTPSPG